MIRQRIDHEVKMSCIVRGAVKNQRNRAPLRLGWPTSTQVRVHSRISDEQSEVI